MTSFPPLKSEEALELAAELRAQLDALRRRELDALQRAADALLCADGSPEQTEAVDAALRLRSVIQRAQRSLNAMSSQ
jgi:hypothetical protein